MINYNKYIETESEYRKNILNNQFNFKITDGMYDKIPEYGGGKTFKENERRDDVKLKIGVFHLIAINKIFLDLVEEYFGYNLINKLKKHLPTDLNLKYG